ncbi:glycosyltransferase family 39 protein [Patescibacteria group bacterium]
MNQFTASLWGDEGWAVTLAVKPIWKIITIVAKDTSPPFYYLCQHTWMKIFSTSEISIRALSFLFFLITVLTVYLIGKHLWDKKTGLWAAVLTFFNPFLFIYAFEGRMYAALLATSTLSVYFFLRKKRLGFVLSTAAALYSHHFAIFVVFWEFLWQIKRSWGQPIKKFILDFKDFFFIGLLYTPWIYPLYYQTSMVAGGFWLGKPTLETLIETFRKFVVGSGKETSRIIALGGVIFAMFLKKWLKDKEKTIFLIGWFLTPVMVTFFLSQVMQSIFYDRYMLVAIPGFTLLIASLRRKLSFIPIIVVIICLATLNYHYFTHPTKRPFREFAAMVKKEAPGLTLINHSGAAHHLWETKYYGLNAPIYSPQDLPFFVGTALMMEGDIIKELPDANELGVVTTASAEEVSLPGYFLVETQQVGDIKFLRMKRNLENKEK